ncbi:MAG TPA: AAA family ATPase, partial [Thermoanaerobaculia bacterium]
MDLDAHFDRLLALLATEREAERTRFEQATARLSLAERAARGICVPDADPVEEGALSGRALVTYETRGGGSEMGVGSLVRISPRREPAADAPTGVVARRSRSRIGVAFDDAPP